jgi:hypothetical protein
MGSLTATIFPGEGHFVAYCEQTFAALLEDLGQTARFVLEHAVLELVEE